MNSSALQNEKVTQAEQQAEPPQEQLRLLVQPPPLHADMVISPPGGQPALFIP